VTRHILGKGVDEQATLSPVCIMSGRTVSLVLGSGGARGLAHIGVIQWLEHHGFDIRSIAGTSMGALVGGIYAAGRLPLYTRWATALERRDVIRLLDFSFSRNSLFKGERVIGELKVLIGNPDIGTLPVAFTAVATDMDSGREVWLNSGPLFDAIRASMAIPTVFAPYTIQGRRLMDGGLVNPVPIAPTLADNTDLTIAVNLNGEPRSLPPSVEQAEGRRDGGRYRENIAKLINELQHRWGPEAEESGFFDIVSRSMDIMQDLISQFKLTAYAPDITVDIPRNVCSFYEFHRASEVIEAGRYYARQSLRDLAEEGSE